MVWRVLKVVAAILGSTLLLAVVIWLGAMIAIREDQSLRTRLTEVSAGATEQAVVAAVGRPDRYSTPSPNEVAIYVDRYDASPKCARTLVYREWINLGGDYYLVCVDKHGRTTGKVIHIAPHG